MKKILMIITACLLVAGGAVAQTKKAPKAKKKESPVIEGRHKIRQTDYEQFNRFTQFSSKDLTRYYAPFDWSQMAELVKKDSPAWGESFQPVMNYLEKVTRATMTICALYAVNPDIDDAARRAELASQAQKEAIDAMETFDAWKVAHKMRNKVQYKVAEVDYRYFKGADYYNNQTDDETIHVGVLLYFGSKKKLIIDPDTTTRTFSDIRFFPNDATIQPSWYTLLDEVVQYLGENERKGVLLTGYSDNRGTDAYIQGLSRQRATEVKKALVMRGIDAERIEVEVKGDEDPIGDNNTYEGRVQNNRVSIKIQ